MAHRDWDSDEFLDDFLDFDYRKPVPDREEKSSKGLPTDKRTEKKTAQRQDGNRKYGLSDEYKYYESLRAKREDAGTKVSEQKESQYLQSSVAAAPEILEPLSARRKKARPKKVEDTQPGDAVATSANTADAVKSEPPAAAAKASDKTETRIRKEKPSLLSGLKNHKHINATEIASEALATAKKFVAAEEDAPLEEIPAPASDANALRDLSKVSAKSSSDSQHVGILPAPGEKDELTELFAELGESSEALSADDNDAIRKAQEEAYDRYRGNYVRNVKKKAAAGKAGAFTRWLSVIYIVALAAFAVMMTVMNVLPFGMLIVFYVLLGLLSVIIVMQLRKSNVKKWARAAGSVAAICLIILFGVGTAYATGTLSFLDATSVSNSNRVASVQKEPFNVCITGIDVDGTIDEQGRSDVNMIVTVNPKTEQILMTSIPRDYEIYMPDKDLAMDKLTHTGFYGVDTTIGAEENLLDTRINYYVKVNFTTVKEFVDAIGGVDVYSEYEFTPVKMKSWTVQEGWNHMNGKQALAFARERKAFLDGDNQRIKNQQAVFEAILKKAMSSKTMVLSYNKILSNLRDYFQMSFSSGELRSLVRLQLSKDPDWQIFRNTIRGGDGSLPTFSTGGAYAYVMTQDQTSIDNAKTLMNAVLEGRTLEKDDDGQPYVPEDESTDNGDSEE